MVRCRRLCLIMGVMMCLHAVAAQDKTGGCQKMPGSTVCNGESLTDLFENGIVNLNDTQVRGKLQVNGTLVARQSTLNQTLINGQVEFYDTDVLGEMMVHGMLQALRCRFLGEITVTSNRLILENSQAKGITVLPEGPDQHVQLLGHTVVTGTIRFISGQGVVEVGPGASVAGQVEGGKLVTRAS